MFALQLWEWFYDHMPLFVKVESRLRELTSPYMAAYWEITVNTWKLIGQEFHNGCGTVDNRMPPKLKVVCHPDMPPLTETEAAAVKAMTKWITAAMSNKIDLVSDQSPQQQRDNILKFGPFLDISALKTDPLTKIFPGFPPGALKEYPLLRMLYRHSTEWATRKYRSKPESSAALALQCYYGGIHYLAQTSRLLLTSEGVEIREEFITFLSSCCQPTLDNFTGPASHRKPKANRRWVNWDDALLETYRSRATVEFARFSDDIGHTTDLQRLEMVNRRNTYMDEVNTVIRLVSRSSAATYGDKKKKFMDPRVRTKLQELAEVCTSHYLEFILSYVLMGPLGHDA